MIATSPVTPRRFESSGRLPAFAIFLCLATVAILFFRRPDQFFNPGIWVEDGTVILKAYAERGLASIVEPVSGYHILSSKIIALLAFKISIRFAPEIMLALTIALTCSVICAIALSPTFLPWPAACALAALLVPIDGEVFAVSELSFWWAGLLLFLALAWRSECAPAWRHVFIVFGGLSSPAILPIAPLLAVRALAERDRNAVIAAAVACLIAAIQGLTIVTHPNPYGPLPFSLVSLSNGAAKLGVPFLFALLVGGGVLLRPKPHLSFFLLGIAALALCAMTLARLPLDYAHPLSQGPRYFFYPYIIAMWLAIWVSAKANAVVRVGIMAALGCIVAYAVLVRSSKPYQGFSRRHVPIYWRADLAACVARNGPFRLPIQFDGSKNDAWVVELTGEQCRDLINRSLLTLNRLN
jgi:hypothetical protein